MKIKSIKYTLGILIFSLVLSGCSKNEDAISSIQNTKNDILTFSSSEDYYSYLDKVNKMSSAARKILEISNNFTSFGTSCDDFYYKTDFSQFATIEDLKKFVLKNNNYLQLYTSTKGDTYCLEQSFNSPERYLMNKDKMYIVGKTVYKLIDDVYVTTDISNFELLKRAVSLTEITSKPMFEIHSTSLISKTQKVKNEYEHYFDEFNDVGIYRLHVYFDTFNYFEVLDGSAKYRMTYFKIMNFKKGFLGIWYGLKISTSFSYYIESYDDWSGLYQHNYPGTTGTNQPVDTYYDRFPNIKALNDGGPYISDYQVTVTNTAGCSITNQNFW